MCVCVDMGEKSMEKKLEHAFGVPYGCFYVVILSEGNASRKEDHIDSCLIMRAFHDCRKVHGMHENMNVMMTMSFIKVLHCFFILNVLKTRKIVNKQTHTHTHT